MSCSTVAAMALILFSIVLPVFTIVFQPLGALLGYMFERGLHERGLELVDRPRRMPLPEEGQSRVVVVLEQGRRNEQDIRPGARHQRWDLLRGAGLPDHLDPAVVLDDIPVQRPLGARLILPVAEEAACSVRGCSGSLPACSWRW